MAKDRFISRALNISSIFAACAFIGIVDLGLVRSADAGQFTQVFPNYDGTSSGFSGAKADTTSPTATITQGFNNAPLGVSDITTGGLFVEAGPTKDCYSNACGSIYPYTSYRGLGTNNTRQVMDTRYPLTPGKYYTYQVKYAGNSTWEPSWCDGSTCRTFLEPGTTSIIRWNLGTGRTLKYAVSGIESTPVSNPIGTVTSKNNQSLYAGTWTSWNYNNIFWNPENPSSQSSTIRCSGVFYCWTMQFPLGISSKLIPQFISLLQPILVADAQGSSIAQAKQQPVSPVQPRPLNGLTQTQLEQYIEDVVVSASSGARRGNPKVIAARFIRSKEDLKAIGLEGLYSDQDTIVSTQVIAIVKGNFDIGDFIPGGEGKTKYVILFFDPETGIIQSKKVGGFGKQIREALKESTILDDPVMSKQDLDKQRKGPPADPNETPEQCNCR
jgi:hypothetical protein